MTQQDLPLPLTPLAGTGLPGLWGVSSVSGLALRADTPCGPLGGILWDQSVADERWRELAALIWQVDGRLRAGSRCGAWVDLGHIIAANGPGYPVVLSRWTTPLVTMPGASCVAVEDRGRLYVRVSLGGEVVAVVMARRVELLLEDS